MIGRRTKWIGDPHQLALHCLVVAQSSLTVEHRDLLHCHRLKQKDTPSEVVHARDFSSVLLPESLNVDLKLVIYSDSSATISQHSKLGLDRMKRVELRFMFVKDLVKREKLSLCKIPGTDNPADLGTKMLDVATHRYLCNLVGLRSVKQAVEEVKGHRRNSQSSGSVGLQNVWKGLRTLCLGLAQWAQENSMSMNFHELRI